MTKYTKQQLPKARAYAQRDPTVPRKWFVALYKVNVTTMNWLILGMQVNGATSNRDA